MTETQGSDVPRLTEAAGDPWGSDYTIAWRCDPPVLGVGYRVIREEWNEDFTVRTILEIELG